MITSNDLVNQLCLVLCEYSKFRMESNSYFGIRFDSKRAQLFKIQGSSRERCLSKNVYSDVVNNGPGPVSP